MNEVRLKGQITRDRQLLVDIPRELGPGAVDVILSRSGPDKRAKRRARRDGAHPAFGLWAKRADIVDAASFAAELRRRVETRADAKPRN
ncbi:MAG: hypothetical protein FJ279_14355 [Planctomycetes bacterium]|nr:hypothetical protein [Planctomycetota bacterium]